MRWQCWTQELTAFHRKSSRPSEQAAGRKAARRRPFGRAGRGIRESTTQG